MTRSVTYVEIDVPSFVPQSPEAIETRRFAVPTDYLSPEIEAIPSIDSISFTPARISLGKDLGERASLKIALRDHKHIFNSEPFDQGTFFGKWRGRYGTRLRGRELRLIRGTADQAIDQMETRYYVIENTDGPTLDGVYTIEAKDILKLADDDRAQAPLLSNGSLAGSINDAATAITLSPAGIGDGEYPASGLGCIGGKEIVSFTRSGDSITITRAQLGTVAQAHSAGDRVQIVLRYTGDNVADIINDLLVNYAGVPPSFIPLSEWQEETSNFLGVIYARTIAEPTSVRDLLSSLVEQAALALYWDDLAKKIRLKVLREIATDTAAFNQDTILEGSLKVKEQPGKRISQIWTYYGQRDPTDSGANKDNFRSAIADADLERETGYGSAEIRKIQARWIETEQAATRLNSIQISRFRDPPRAFSFELFRNELIIPAAGYQLRWWGSQDETGIERPVPIQVTQVRVEADRIYVEAEEMLASGVIVLVHVVFLFATDGAVLEWQLPESWNDDDNFVALFGPGGAGYRNSSQSGGKGGGGGAFSRSTNLALSALSLIQYRVGRGGIHGGINGEDTWFDGAAFESASVAAEGGQNGTSRTGGGQGGQAANGTGDLRTSGGNGGNGGNAGGNRAGGGGGGGAGGPNGDGGNGGGVGSNERGGGGGGGADGGEDVTAAAQGSTGTDGGNNRFGFGGGTQQTPAGSEGGGGKGGNGFDTGSLGGNGEQLWTQTVAPIQSAGPGGGGGGGGALGSGADGGNYGGGGGGTGGDGAQAGRGAPGLVVIGWREAAA